jgi:hypothetical protein
MGPGFIEARPSRHRERAVQLSGKAGRFFRDEQLLDQADADPRALDREEALLHTCQALPHGGAVGLLHQSRDRRGGEAPEVAAYPKAMVGDAAGVVRLVVVDGEERA